MAVGKHKHKLFREIVDEDPSYCVWASELQSPTESMQKFQAYLLKHELADLESQEQTPKRRRVDAEDPVTGQAETGSLECKICYSRAINVVFRNCGHLVACAFCADRCDKCPICRVPIRPGDIIRTFTA